MRTITVTLPYPISENRYSRPVVIKGRSISVLTKEAKLYKAEIASLLRAAGVATAISGRVQVDIKLYPHRPLDWEKRMRKFGAEWDNTVQRIDLDNARKLLNDSMNGIAFVDDYWIWKDSGEVMEPDEHGKRLVVTITALAVEQPQVSMFEEVEA